MSLELDLEPNLWNQQIGLQLSKSVNSFAAEKDKWKNFGFGIIMATANLNVNGLSLSISFTIFAKNCLTCTYIYEFYQ